MKKQYEKPEIKKAGATLQARTADANTTGVLGTNVSDIRLKKDISRVGNTPTGIPLYQFRYLDGATRYEGVMAQDVLAVDPQAVSVGPDGYYRVDYARLGLEMRVCD